MNVIEKLFGTHSERELKMIRPIVAKIESLRPEMMAKSDEELRDQTRIFRERLAKDESLAFLKSLDGRKVEASAIMNHIGEILASAKGVFRKCILKPPIFVKSETA